jgi:hypothetical protein
MDAPRRRYAEPSRDQCRDYIQQREDVPLVDARALLVTLGGEFVLYGN